MAPRTTFTALPSSSMVEAASDAYREVLADAEARGMGDLGGHLAMSAALTAGRVAAPSVTHDQVRQLADMVAVSDDARVVLLDALRSFGVQVYQARETVDA